MCGRYALGIRASLVRWQLQQQNMPVDEAPADEDVRETYNFPPGAFGLVYRANVPDNGLQDEQEQPTEHARPSTDGTISTDTDQPAKESRLQADKTYDFQLQAMKWGLIPFWTKRSPDYGSMLKTINCRDDSLIENRGLWNTMKQKKRCIVVAQGFYEWLKKGPGGKEKVPHFVKRQDGNLMCFAGLWDCVKYEDAEKKLYTYTIITTNSNKQLNFLHDRMPVILDADTDAMRMWLDPTQNRWTKELQDLLKPYEGQLECYPVNKDVGKVGNNSPDFIVPIDSKENKMNIANFFGNAAQKKKDVKVEHETVEGRDTKDHDTSENHAPVPVPSQDGGIKRKLEDVEDDAQAKAPKLETLPPNESPSSKSTATRRTRSAISNEGRTLKTSPKHKAEDGSQRITNFFTK